MMNAVRLHKLVLYVIVLHFAPALSFCENSDEEFKRLKEQAVGVSEMSGRETGRLLELATQAGPNSITEIFVETKNNLGFRARLSLLAMKESDSAPILLSLLGSEEFWRRPDLKNYEGTAREQFILQSQEIIARRIAKICKQEISAKELSQADVRNGIRAKLSLLVIEATK